MGECIRFCDRKNEGGDPWFCDRKNEGDTWCQMCAHVTRSGFYCVFSVPAPRLWNRVLVMAIGTTASKIVWGDASPPIRGSWGAVWPGHLVASSKFPVEDHIMRCWASKCLLVYVLCYRRLPTLD